MNIKKKILSAAVLSAVGIGSAQAVYISTEGTGQAMLIPYYTVQGGNETLISIVNTVDETKIVKIRFREAMNSKEVLDFNIYMSPHDVWTGKVQAKGDDSAQLITGDSSCTVPAIPATGVEFRNYEFTGSKVDGATTAQSRVREGYVEILEMGVAAPITNGVWDGDNDNHLDTTHIAGTPENCATVVANWAPGGVWVNAPATEVGNPTGGLYGASAIIRVDVGTEISQPVTILDGFYATQVHTAPGSLLPSVGQAAPVSDVALNSATAAASFDRFTSNWAGPAPRNPVDAVSAVLASNRLINQYTVNPAVEGETDWVVTFPTKWYYVNNGTDFAYRPFTSVFYNSSDTKSPVNNGKACEAGIKQYFDREEAYVQGDVDFSPLPPGSSFDLCYEANVLNFGDSDVLSSQNVSTEFTLATGFNNGWASIGFADDDQTSVWSSANTLVTNAGRRLDSTDGDVYHGLPAIGYRATRLLNGNVGVGAAYAVSDEHAYDRYVSGTAD
jgi:hypothetical protein